MSLSNYDVKRIASEIAAQNGKELSRKINSEVDKTISEISDKWLTTTQARRFLNISERQLYRLKAEGIIPYSKPRGRVYYRRSALINYLDNIK